jgi:hypothetical protein
MVRSRSETNLNRIFFDLCTSLEVRTTHDHQKTPPRQYHRPLPSLQAIKSNSCSNLNELTPNLAESSSSFASDHTEQLESTKLQPIESTAIPLVPMESTGFTVQTTTSITPQLSFKLFETLTINHSKKSALLDQTPKGNYKSNSLPLTSTPSNTSEDWKQQDFTNRLRNRLKSRGHLRKFFLS